MNINNTNSDPHNCLVLGVNSINSISLNFSPNTTTYITSLTINPNQLSNEDILLIFTAEIPLIPTGETLVGYFKINRIYNNLTTDLGQAKFINITSDISPEVISYQFIDNAFNCNCYNFNSCITYLIEFVSNPTSTTETIAINNIVISAKKINNENSSDNYISKFASGTSGLKLSNITAENALNPIPLGSISLDLSNFNEPIVLLTYSGDFAGESAFFFTSSQNFNVVRYCGDLTTEVSSNFIAGGTNVTNSQIFYYQICDCDLTCCTDCNITYVVNLLPGFIAADQVLSINNIEISAYVFEKDICDFNCIKGNSIFIFSDNVGANIVVPEIEIASISFNSSDICNRDVLLTFSENVSFRFTRDILDTTVYSSTNGRILLFRECNGTSEVLLNSYFGIQTPELDVTSVSTRISELSSFQFYDKCIQCTCCDCITYSLRLQFGPNIFADSLLAITNPVLTTFIC